MTPAPAPHPADLPGPMVLVADPARPELPDDAVHHLTRVLRLRSGAPIVVADGRGSWAPALLQEADRAEVAGPVLSAPAPAPTLTVAFALVKGDKPELVVQKLTELGVDRIVPFRADRSVVRWDAAKAAKAVARLRAVAASATAQCHRPWLPEVAEVTDLPTLLADGAAMADRVGEPVSLDHPIVAVGPEGGWSDAEAALDAPRVRLTEHVLRSETAAVTSGALLAALRAGTVARVR
ncbi:MAG: RsmE family RNA methyltransferase [Actinomycetota bacterium]